MSILPAQKPPVMRASPSETPRVFVMMITLCRVSRLSYAARCVRYRYDFKPESTMPSVKYFCPIRYMSTAGATDMQDAAMIAL